MLNRLPGAGGVDPQGPLIRLCRRAGGGHQQRIRRHLGAHFPADAAAGVFGLISLFMLEIVLMRLPPSAPYCRLSHRPFGRVVWSVLYSRGRMRKGGPGQETDWVDLLHGAFAPPLDQIVQQVHRGIRQVFQRHGHGGQNVR